MQRSIFDRVVCLQTKMTNVAYKIKKGVKDWMCELRLNLWKAARLYEEEVKKEEEEEDKGMQQDTWKINKQKGASGDIY